MSTTLEQRIAQMLAATNVGSDALIDLLGELDRALESVDEHVERARQRALDPIACPDAGKARAELEATEFNRDRLKGLRPRVERKIKEVSAQEEYAAWAKKFDVIPALHAAAAKRLRDVYTRFEEELVEALRDAAVVDRHLTKVMETKPRTGSSDRRSLPKVEAAARGTDQIPLEAALMSTRLFKFDQPTVRIWPPSEPLPKSPAEIALDDDERREINERMRAVQRMREAKAAEEAARAEAKAAEERERHAQIREAWLRKHGEMAGSTL
jgi:hypothetical protein